MDVAHDTVHSSPLCLCDQRSHAHVTCNAVLRPAGSWDGWSSQTSLTPQAADGAQVRSPRGDAVRTLLVPRGVHDYKFTVDERWRPAPSDPVARDQAVSGSAARA